MNTKQENILLTGKPGKRHREKIGSKVSEPLPAKAPGFLEYLLKARSNRRLFLAALLVNTILLLLYKYCYPLPDFVSDSQGYVHAATGNIKVFYRPFGYARFLQWVHSLVGSHYGTVGAQYFIAVLSAQFCFFTVDYLFRFSRKTIRYGSWLLVTVNPIVLVLSNYILSDMLFISLSVTWFSLLLWSQKRGAWWALLLQLIFLYWCFQVRYTALYYPVLAGMVFLLSPGMKLPYRFAGLLSSFLLIFATYNGIKKETSRATGAETFSGFSGWQMANNALLIYKKADVQPEIFDDPELQLLDKAVRYYIDSIPLKDRISISKSRPSSVFMWDRSSPLKRFATYYGNRYKVSYYMAWYQLSPLYNAYGSKIIRNYPGVYFRNYILPNLGLYFLPDAEVLEKYDVSDVTLSEETRRWFGLKQDKLKAAVPGIQDILIRPYAILRLLLLLFSLVVPLLYFIRFRKITGMWHSSYVLPVLFWYCFLLMDMAFSSIASIMVLRYGAWLLVIGFTLPLYFLDQLINVKGKKPQKATQVIQ